MQHLAGLLFCFLSIRGPPRSTPIKSSAASDVYKRQPTGAAEDRRQTEALKRPYVMDTSDGAKLQRKSSYKIGGELKMTQGWSGICFSL